MINGADVLVQELKNRDIDCIYTLCGNGLDPLFQACLQNGMRVIDSRNEQGAAYMADAAGRLTGKVGVVAVSTGVAHLNALTGVCNAWFDGAPMLLITSASDSATIGRGNFQDMDTVTLARPLCKFADNIDRPDRVALQLEAALGAATSGRPGAAHLTIPVDVLSGEVTHAGLPTDRPVTACVQPGGPADPEAVAEAVKLLAAAERPFIIAGSGCFYADASVELEQLAALLKAPVTVPIWDRGAVENPIPEWVGAIGAASGGPSIMPDADLILMFGAQVDYRVGYLDPPAVSPDALVVRCSVDPGELTQGANPHVGLLGDPRLVMAQLIEALEADGHAGSAEWLAEAQARDGAFRARWLEEACPDGPPCTGRHIVDSLRQVITDETFFLVDGGNIGQWVHMAMCDRYPARWLTCGRSAVVGWGIPSAAAVKSLNPDSPVLLLSGDGSSTFTIADIECAARQKLPYVAVIADDSAWGIVVSGCRKSGRTPVACELGPIDFAKVAEGFGARGVRIDDPTQLPAAVEAGFAETEVPTIVHVPICTGGPAD